MAVSPDIGAADHAADDCARGAGADGNAFPSPAWAATGMAASVNTNSPALSILFALYVRGTRKVPQIVPVLLRLYNSRSIMRRSGAGFILIESGTSDTAARYRPMQLVTTQ